jgi:hypothetical protein
MVMRAERGAAARTDGAKRAAPLGDGGDGRQRVAPHRLVSRHVVQRLEVEALLRDHQAPGLAHQRPQLCRAAPQQQPLAKVEKAASVEGGRLSARGGRGLRPPRGFCRLSATALGRLAKLSGPANAGETGSCGLGPP